MHWVGELDGSDGIGGRDVIGGGSDGIGGGRDGIGGGSDGIGCGSDGVVGTGGLIEAGGLGSNVPGVYLSISKKEGPDWDDVSSKLCRLGNSLLSSTVRSDTLGGYSV